MKSFLAVYGNPDSHGPQICAIHMISQHSTDVDLLYRNVSSFKRNFPENVILHTDSKFRAQEEIYKKGAFVKLIYFLKYLIRMSILLLRNKYHLIVLFDPISFLAFCLVNYFVKIKAYVWYHNFDAIYIEYTKKYSLAWFAYKAPYYNFSNLDLFSLPMEERVKYFPVNKLHNSYTIIPNYSMIELHKSEIKKIEDDNIYLLFVGTISPGHGLEEIISCLDRKISGKTINLVLKGYISFEYKNFIIQLALTNKVSNRLSIIPIGPWDEVPIIIQKCHIGIAIYTGKDKMNSSLGKGGSGKIFQYIAEGLPVLINSEFHAKYYYKEKWAIPTELTNESLQTSIARILNDYNFYTENALRDFKQKYNCNLLYNPILNSINKLS